MFSYLGNFEFSTIYCHICFLLRPKCSVKAITYFFYKGAVVDRSDRTLWPNSNSDRLVYLIRVRREVITTYDLQAGAKLWCTQNLGRIANCHKATVQWGIHHTMDILQCISAVAMWFTVLYHDGHRNVSSVWAVSVYLCIWRTRQCWGTRCK